MHLGGIRGQQLNDLEKYIKYLQNGLEQASGKPADT
jgi:hypothetical protein